MLTIRIPEPSRRQRLLTSGIAYFAYDLHVARQQLAQELESTSGLLATNATAVLAFDDSSAGATLLQSLHTRPYVPIGVLFGADETSFASYVRLDLAHTATVPPFQKLVSGSTREKDRLKSLAPIFLGSRQVGFLYLERDFVRLKQSSFALRLLLVEDNKVNQKLGERLLSKMGHRVTLASNGQLAVHLALHKQFDLILMGIQMPVMSGTEATRLIRDSEKKNGGHVPIIAMTAHAMAGDAEKFFASGMDGYISKLIRQALLRRNRPLNRTKNSFGGSCYE